MRHDKLDRELTLLLLLTENRSYTIQQLCDRLGISRRNLYYYLDFFRDYGFQVEKHGTAYSLDKSSPFFTKLFRTVHFTEDEAITMRRLLDRMDDHSVQVQHLKQKIDALYDLHILDDVQLREQQAQNVSVIYDAIKYHRCVVLHGYSSGHSQSQRDRVVEPFMFLSGNNEVRAYEPSSRLNKTFRLSRMESVELLADEWMHEQEHRRVYTDIFHFSDEHLLPVSVRLTRLAYNLLIEEYPKSEAFIVAEGDARWRLDTDVCSYAGIGRFVMGLYDEVEVLGDEAFRHYISSRIRAMHSSLPVPQQH